MRWEENRKKPQKQRTRTKTSLIFCDCNEQQKRCATFRVRNANKQFSRENFSLLLCFVVMLGSLNLINSSMSLFPVFFVVVAANHFDWRFKNEFRWKTANACPNHPKIKRKFNFNSSALCFFHFHSHSLQRCSVSFEWFFLVSVVAKIISTATSFFFALTASWIQKKIIMGFRRVDKIKMNKSSTTTTTITKKNENECYKNGI